MTLTFVPYGDKSGAKRGFGRIYKDFEGNVDDYLDKIDGKWGFSKGEDDKPVLVNAPPPVPAPPAYKVIWPGTEVKKAPAPASEEDFEPAPSPSASAFSSFAASQLGGGAKPHVIIFTRAPAEPKVDRNRPENNGVKRPSDGTICAHIWSLATQITAEKTAPAIATLSEVINAAETVGVNKYTARTQYARWRVFNGHTGKK